jgi:hypothetical protein
MDVTKDAISVMPSFFGTCQWHTVLANIEKLPGPSGAGVMFRTFIRTFNREAFAEQ